MNDKIFADGIYFDAPKDGTPDFVKGKVSFNVSKAIIFLKENENEKGYVNLDLLKSKAGKLYFQLNNWVPEDMKGKEEHMDIEETHGLSEDEFKQYF